MKQLIPILVLLFISVNIFAQTPTKWRGPNGTGVYNETGLLKIWPENGPEVAWVYKGLDKGHSSPAFANGKIYLTTMIDTMGYLVVLSEEGKLIKQIPYASEWTKSYEGSRSTPTIVDDLAYVLSSKGKMFCINLKDYSIKWKKDLFKDFDGENITWGVTETLVVDGDKIFCSPGGKKNNVIALNRFSGELIWSCAGKGGSSAYCTPLLVKLENRKLLVTIMSDNVLGIDVASGELLWSYPKVTKYSVNANTPYYLNGELYCLAGYGSGGFKLKLSSDGSSVTLVWENENLDNQMGGLVVLDGYVYSSGHKNREWQCVDWKTGKLVWESSDLGKGVVIAADGMLYCYSDKGELALAHADSSGFNIVSRVKVEEGESFHWAHPVIHNGILYVRHGDALVAYKIR